MSAAKGTSLQNQFQEELEAMKKIQKLQQKALSDQQTLDSQLNENKLVKEELGILEEGAVVYKLVGPTLLKQDLNESKTNVDKRIDYISKEFKRTVNLSEDYEKKLDNHREKISSIQSSIQQLRRP
uniref:Probable prefoldin subunit 6 n=1 Tax=Caligus rogercresseyi TaxID=217165 RepID=C1BQI0_CALRO|nr:Probable prefoldin subunit 6 [Caligus rogercresseyi]